MASDLVTDALKRSTNSINNFNRSTQTKQAEDPNLDSLMAGIARFPEKNKADTDEMDWEEPLLFDDTKMPVFDTNIFPPEIKKYVEELAEEMQTPIDLPGMSVLNVLSACLAGKFHVHPYGEWQEPLNLYEIYAMPPSSKKSPVHKAVTKYIREYEAHKIDQVKPDVLHKMGAKAAIEKRIEALNAQYAKAKDNDSRDKILEEIGSLREEIDALEMGAVFPTYITGGDATPEKVAVLLNQNHERLAIISPEGNDLFSMMSGRYTEKPNIDIYLSAFSQEPYIMQRMKRVIKLDNPLLTIGLFVQNSVIQNSDHAFKERGLLQRFLYCIPDSNVGHRKIRPKLMSDETKNAYKSITCKLMDYSPDKDIELALSSEADGVLRNMQAVNEQELGNEDADVSFIEWKGKLVGNILRIAGILHVTTHFKGEQTPSIIDEDTFSKAASMYYYLSAHAAKAFDISEGEADENDERKLFTFICELQKDGQIDRRQIQKNKNYFKSKAGTKKLEAAEVALQQRKLIRIAHEGKNRKKVYKINPLALTQEKNSTSSTSEH